MPTNPMTEAQRRRKTGEWHRIRGITRPPEYPIGATTYVKARQDGGLTIGKGPIRILLDADEAERLINVAQELTKPTSPHATTPAKATLMRYPASPDKRS
jgi:hypothetical protein